MCAVGTVLSNWFDEARVHAHVERELETKETMFQGLIVSDCNMWYNDFVLHTAAPENRNNECIISQQKRNEDRRSRQSHLITNRRVLNEFSAFGFLPPKSPKSESLAPFFFQQCAMASACLGSNSRLLLKKSKKKYFEKKRRYRCPLKLRTIKRNKMDTHKCEPYSDIN